MGYDQKNNPAKAREAEEMLKFKLTEKQIGFRSWPFTVDHVTIMYHCKTKAVFVKAGNLYNLNGAAKKGRLLEEIWLYDPAFMPARKSVGFILRMCRNRGWLL